MPADPPDLAALARAVGLCAQWTTADGVAEMVSAEDLVSILGQLGYEADSDAARRRSLHRVAHEASLPPRFLSVDVGQPLDLPASLASATAADLVLEDGRSRIAAITDGRLQSIDEPGYHSLHLAGHELVLAVAPAGCTPPPLGAESLWGPVVQIPSLRGVGAYGTLADLGEAAACFGKRGADLLAISPIHAVFPGRGEAYSPYSPSSRQYLNMALAFAPVEAQPAALIDWEKDLPASLDRMRAAFLRLTPADRRGLRDWAARQPADLIRHAIYEAIYLDQGGRPWQHWPVPLRGWTAPGVEPFAADHGDAIDLGLFGQWTAERALADAQGAAKAGGMAIGLIADLAVGVDAGGSDVWANPDAYLQGLTIGAPPDPLGPEGQNWGLTTFSPAGLRTQAFAPWIALLRATLRHAGGIRIDHAFGLQRLWIIPEGSASSRGAYLGYPVDDLLRILSLESRRSGGIVIAEDLGTVPAGFRERLETRGIFGMSVLWFERDARGGFKGPADYAARSAGMTGTHDTPTIAGWWRGRDLDWRARLSAAPDPDPAREERASERALLWDRIGDGTPAPANDASGAVVDAAMTHISSSAAALKIVPIEDILGLEDQVNVPGTTHEHPNWRRRLPAPTPVMLDRPEILRRIDLLNRDGHVQNGAEPAATAEPMRIDDSGTGNAFTGFTP